jgi:hypothetical protein
MGMLIFFIVSLIGGVMAGFYAERIFESDSSYYGYGSKQSNVSIMSRLRKISRQI